jgi:sulfide dehydrogenase cytochrome subunit
MMMNRNTMVLLATCLLLTASPGIASDLESLMNTCNDCHGDNGVSQWSDVPTIGGLAEFVHADALYIYRDNERPCTDSAYRQGDTSRPETNMCAISADMSDDDIDAIAAAYAELPYVRAEQDFDAALAAAGKAVHDKGCNRCHSKAGTDPEDEAGMLGGQQIEYLRKAFSEYAEDSRYQPEKMQEAMDALSAEDVEALLNHYASQQ